MKASAPTQKTHPHMRDASEPFVFTVTTEHTKGSVVGDPSKCAGSCALTSIDGVKRAWVHRTTAIIEFDDGRVLRWANPIALQKAVEQFDVTSGLFPPGTYKLRVTPPSQRLGTPRAQKTSESKPARKRLRPAYALR